METWVAPLVSALFGVVTTWILNSISGKTSKISDDIVSIKINAGKTDVWMVEHSRLDDERHNNNIMRLNALFDEMKRIKDHKE